MSTLVGYKGSKRAGTARTRSSPVARTPKLQFDGVLGPGADRHRRQPGPPQDGPAPATTESSSHGRLDMAVLFNDNVYLFEFKVVEMASEGAAMAQLKEKRYADKYRALGQPIHLIAVEFSKDTRNLVAFDVERA